MVHFKTTGVGYDSELHFNLRVLATIPSHTGLRLRGNWYKIHRKWRWVSVAGAQFAHMVGLHEYNVPPLQNETHKVPVSLVYVAEPAAARRYCTVQYNLGAVTNTGHPLQVSLLGRSHDGHSLVLDKFLYIFHTRHRRTE